MLTDYAGNRMWTDRLLMAVLCGVTLAIPFCLLGALCGACARLAGKWFDRVPEATMYCAAMKGSRSGGLFLGVVGFVSGGLLGWIRLPGDTLLLTLSATFWLLVVAMVAASVVGGMAFAMESLGSMRLANVVALAVNGLFLVASIRFGIMRSVWAEGRLMGPLGDFQIWISAVLAGGAILALLLGLVWFCRLIYGGAGHRMGAGKRNVPAVEKPA